MFAPHHRRFLAIATTLVAIALATMFRGLVLGESHGTPEASPAAGTVCVFQGTPVSTALDVQRSGCDAAALGEPYRIADMVVTMTFSSDRARPQDVTITITDTNGNPVTDATIVLINRHLEMDHGDFVHEFGHTSGGTYVEKNVGMGMGGRWQTEIQISRPGHDTVTVVFQERLKGIGE